MAGPHVDRAARLQLHGGEPPLRDFRDQGLAGLRDQFDAYQRTGGVDVHDFRFECGQVAGPRVDGDVVRADEHAGLAVDLPAVFRKGQLDGAEPHGSLVHPAVKGIDIAEEVHDELIGGPVKYLVGRADLLDPAPVRDDDAVGDFEGLFLIVRDEYAGDLQLIVQSAEPGAKLLADFGVESAEGLVEQKNLGFDGEGAGESDPLALSPGELVGVSVRHAVELYEFQQFIDSPADVLLVGTLFTALDAQAEGDILEDIHVAEQRVVLENESDTPCADVTPGHILVVKQNASFAGIGLLQPRNDAKERGLSRAGRPDQRHQFPAGDGQADIVQRLECSESLADISNFDTHG